MTAGPRQLLPLGHTLWSVDTIGTIATEAKQTSLFF
jgi:hypothetical protein